MKRVLFLLFAVSMCMGVYAQKVQTKFLNTEARKVNVISNAYVKPLTVEVQVIGKQRITEVIKLSKEEVDALHNDQENIRNFAVYRACKLHNCDMIVAAISNIKSEYGQTEVEIMGYPANFINWKTATQADTAWIKLEKTLTISDREKIAATIKTK